MTEDITAYRFTKRVIGRKYPRWQYVVTYNDRVIEKFASIQHHAHARVKDGKCQGVILAGLEKDCPPDWVLIPVQTIKTKKV